MSVGRGFQLPDYKHQSSYGEIPLDNWLRLGLVKQQEDEKSAAEEDAITNSILSLKSTKMDQPHAKELVNSYLEQLDSWHNKYKDNLEAGSEELRELKRKLIMDQTQGKWSTIANRYAAEQEAIKAHKSAEEEYIKSGGTKGTHPDDVDLSLNYTIANQDPLDKINKWGELPGYKSHTLLPSIDLNALGLELAKEASPQVLQYATGLKDVGDYIKDGKIKTESLPAEYLNKLVKYSLMTNDKARGYVDWKNRMNGNLDRYNLLAQNNFSDGISSYNPEYVQDELLYKDINEAANQASMLKAVNNRYEDFNYREDWREKQRSEQDINNIARFSMQGIGINPGTLEKSASELAVGIDSIKNHNDLLRAELQGVTPNSAEANQIEGQIAWNTMLLQKKAKIQADAEKFSNQKITEEDKKIIQKFGNWNPGNLNDPNFLAQIKKHNLPSTTTVKEVLKAMGSKDPINDAKKLSAAYNRKNIYSDKYLEEQAKNFTIQPSLISLDSKQGSPTSKALSSLYNSGMGAWQVFDENGPISDPNFLPSNVEFNQITEQPIDNLGYMYSVTSIPKEGSSDSPKKYYIKPVGNNNINEKIGLDLVKENQPKENNFRSPEERRRYNMGLNMISPIYANQVSQLKLGEKQDLLNGAKSIGKISKENTAHGVVYKLNLDGYNPGTYGSAEEVLQILNRIK